MVFFLLSIIGIYVLVSFVTITVAYHLLKAKDVKDPKKDSRIYGSLAALAIVLYYVPEYIKLVLKIC